MSDDPFGHRESCPWEGDKKNFDPYLDWDKITQEQAQAFATGIARYKRTTDALLDLASPEKCAEAIRAHHELGHIEDDILDSIWTVPMMVHIAGPKEWENHPDEDGRTALIQRCVRCKSILCAFHEHMAVLTPSGPQTVQEEDMTWWAAGAQVAKSKQDAGGMQMYEIPDDRTLEGHEMECVGIPNMEGE